MTRPQGTVQYRNDGRVVVVTGGAQGIGQEICRQFAATGAWVACLDISPQRPTDLPPSVSFFSVDTSAEEWVVQTVATILSDRGAIDVLVNNAAIQPPTSYRPVDEYPLELWEQMVRVNFTGYMLMAKHVLPTMQRQGSGVIVNLASGQGHRTARGVPAYGPIKAANIMQARQWGIEYARQGIRVVSVSPGAIDTPLVRASLQKQGGYGPLAQRHPVGRIGQPAEVAAAVLWLASADASFITATDLEVDGGLGAFGAFADPYPTDLPH